MTPEDEDRLKHLSLQNAEQVAMLTGEVQMLRAFAGILLGEVAADKGGVDYVKRMTERLRVGLDLHPVPGEPGRLAWDQMSESVDRVEQLALSKFGIR